MIPVNIAPLLLSSPAATGGGSFESNWRRGIPRLRPRGMTVYFPPDTNIFANLFDLHLFQLPCLREFRDPLPLHRRFCLLPPNDFRPNKPYGFIHQSSLQEARGQRPS